MKPPTSKFPVKFLHLFLVILLFSPRVAVWHPSFEYEDKFRHFPVPFRVYLFWSAMVHQLCSQAAPRGARTLPAPHQGLATWAYSPYHVMPSQTRVVPSFTTISGFRISLAFFFVLLLPHLMQRCLPAVAHHSIRSSFAPLFLSTKIHFSLGMSLSSSQSHHSSTRQRKLAAYCNDAYTSSLFLQDCAGPNLRHNSPTIVAASFAGSSAFSLPSVIRCSNSVICCFSFLE